MDLVFDKSAPFLSNQQVGAKCKKISFSVWSAGATIDGSQINLRYADDTVFIAENLQILVSLEMCVYYKKPVYVYTTSENWKSETLETEDRAGNVQ